MDKPHLDPNTNLLTKEYVQGIGKFMRLVQQQPDAKSGFSRNYKVWYLHGKTGYEYGNTSEPQPVSELQHDISVSDELWSRVSASEYRRKFVRMTFLGIRQKVVGRSDEIPTNTFFREKDTDELVRQKFVEIGLFRRISDDFGHQNPLVFL
ncbi:hypothetical protein DY000_02050343 [Brassica cretica]|uniref:Uncharacterized protein n=1 Tax=Brassica cretica TaxID=69181 RepID=A0ABQ7EXT2_BRACR|nr:hypothetical protein DY000_02050343 [Brassica cretica]